MISLHSAISFCDQIKGVLINGFPIAGKMPQEISLVKVQDCFFNIQLLCNSKVFHGI